MRTTTATLLAAGLVVATVAPAAAHPEVQLDPTLPTDVTFAATDNVEYLGRFPEHTGNAGGRLVGDRFYLTDPRGVYVYDVSSPAAPQLLGSLPLFQDTTGVALAQEDPDTDGEILLVDAIDPASPTPLAQLQVVDVSDPADGLEVIGTVDVVDHTWTCVSAPALPGSASDRARERSNVRGEGHVDSCAYAYGRSGHIVDLTDPTDPQLLGVTWREAVDYGDRGNSPYAHDLTEIRPGLVMSAGEAAILMDTSDPTAPVEVARIHEEGRFTSLGYHSVEWANDGHDPYLVLGTEIAPGSSPRNLAGTDCEGENSVIETWDAATFERIDTFDAGGRGIFLDGQAPGHTLYCAHWMELHPDFDGGGKMVVSYYDRGTRFVDVAADGTMAEIGWIVPADAYSGSAQWITDEIVYIMDYRRGLEVVRLHDQEATGTYQHTQDVVAAGSTVAPARGAGGSADGTAGAGSLAVGLLLLGVEGIRRRRRTTRC